MLVFIHFVVTCVCCFYVFFVVVCFFLFVCLFVCFFGGKREEGRAKEVAWSASMYNYT